jgi:hydrogenase maturation protein HypF
MAEGGVRIEIDGLVQGVGFRPWVHGLARAAAIRGRVWNHPSGVAVEAFGEGTVLREFVAQLAHPPMAAASVRKVRSRPIQGEHLDSFEIVASRGGRERSPSIPPDLATCAECLRELRSPLDRRHGYPFINCTRCGPRYSIALDVPYDRLRTTMAEFRMCAACRREYEDPRDRRFHAQPNACSACGPHLRLVEPQGASLAGDPIARGAEVLKGGGILAVKGLGGYHLACDATSEAAVARLRSRKRRDEKPFAVMVASLAAAEQLAELAGADRELLTAVSRPIVLVPRRLACGLADAVAPRCALVGLILPYTPLHELLLSGARRPLVMTSGNLTDEPMACEDAEALRRLGGIADAFLVHDRAIANRCDDSVARVIAGRPRLLRRGRGFVPASLRIAPPAPRPILACGAHQKSAFCLLAGDRAWLGPHVGDLETDEACRSFESALAHFQRFVGIEPEVVVHDLHPDYFTTAFARRHPAPLRIGVQHHHAHVASAMAEFGLEGPVLGLAWDGTGYGSDGTSWGGEFLVADLADFRRVATFRAFALPGGERAVREVWRAALSVLEDAFEGAPPLEELALFGAVPPVRTDAARRMLAASLNTPLVRGVGRYFDAFGALVLPRAEARYEGQVAAELTAVADAAERRPYPFAIETAAVDAVDLRPTVRAAVADLRASAAPATVSGRFHATLVAAAVEVVRRVFREFGPLPVVLAGGCFQNARLVEDLSGALARFTTVYVPQDVPPSDGGIALGQAVIASARLRRDLSLRDREHGGG